VIDDDGDGSGIVRLRCHRLRVVDLRDGVRTRDWRSDRRADRPKRLNVLNRMFGLNLADDRVEIITAGLRSLFPCLRVRGIPSDRRGDSA